MSKRIIKKRPDGSIKKVQYLTDGKLHSVFDEPAEICHTIPSRTKRSWYSHGKLHRENGSPAVMTLVERKYLHRMWYTNGVFQRSTWDILRPVEECRDFTTEYPDGVVKHEGQFYACEGGSKMYEAWYKNGLLHREQSSSGEGDLPARVYYEDYDRVWSREWFIQGNRHRENGLPAMVNYCLNGKVNYEEYWINGKKIKDVKYMYREGPTGPGSGTLEKTITCVPCGDGTGEKTQEKTIQNF